MAGINGLLGSRAMTDYEAKTITVTTGTTDYDVAGGNTNLFGGTTSKLTMVNKQRTVCKIISNQDITIKFNSTSADGILMKSSESPYYETLLSVTNMYITNTSGSSATITIVLYYVE